MAKLTRKPPKYLVDKEGKFRKLPDHVRPALLCAECGKLLTWTGNFWACGEAWHGKLIPGWLVEFRVVDLLNSGPRPPRTEDGARARARRILEMARALQRYGGADGDSQAPP